MSIVQTKICVEFEEAHEGFWRAGNAVSTGSSSFGIKNMQ